MDPLHYFHAMFSNITLCVQCWPSACKMGNINRCLTSRTVMSSPVQYEPVTTGTVVTSYSVGAGLGTAAIQSGALVNVYKELSRLLKSRKNEDCSFWN